MSQVCNAEVKLRNGESVQKMIKRFFKKCKKNNIVREYLDRTSHFKTKREKRREKTEKNKWLKNKYKSRRK